MGSVKHKRTKVVGRVPTTSQVAEGEIALNLADRLIYTNDGSKVITLGGGMPRVKKWSSGQYVYENGFMFIGTDDKLYMSAQNTHGQYPGNHTNDATHLGIVQVMTPNEPIIDCGTIGNHTCYFLTASGKLYTWGENAQGECGVGNTTTPIRKPTFVASDIARVESPKYVGYEGNTPHCYAQKKNGSWIGWGYNWNTCIAGNATTGGTVNTTKPIAVVGPSGKTIKRIWNGGGNTHGVWALMSDGKLYFKGTSYGGLGGVDDGHIALSDKLYRAWKVCVGLPTLSSTYYNDPYSATFDNYFELVHGWGYRNSTTYVRPSTWVRCNGTIYSTGNNDWSQLGRGAKGADDDRFVAISGMTSVKKIVTNGNGGPTPVHALKTNGELWSWGYAGYGQMGDGGSADIAAPKRTATSVADVWGGKGGHNYGYDSHFYIKKTDGSIWGTGDNATGSLCTEAVWKEIHSSWAKTMWGWIGEVKEMHPMNSQGEHCGTSYAITTDGRLYSAGRSDGGSGQGWWHWEQSNTSRNEMPRRLV
ncbi:hypothetical protein [Vibrio sp. ER1A]|uniref:hypothetical protein n=1 Tax=Vibrio sp. ER1A TaxID=1517681 RepID=UPI0004DD637B|nr:hypothetical protein [Vibrio sp. ER1A]KFA97564.1 hypothetical protein HW45_09150 [Vibrio sp. ER1A]